LTPVLREHDEEGFMTSDKPVVIAGPWDIAKRQAEIALLRAQISQRKYKTDDRWTSALIGVGTGRGFLVNRENGDPFVITAASCLPFLLRPEITFEPDNRNCPALVGSLEGRRRVSAWCHFIGLIDNIAVFGGPSGEECLVDWHGFDLLTEGATPMVVADPPKNSLAWIPSLDGRWFRCAVFAGRHLHIHEQVEDIVAEMAGFPIVADNGSAIGVVSNTRHPADEHWNGMQPRLTEVLPRWLLRSLSAPAMPPMS
jgi:hypothetical protein